MDTQDTSESESAKARAAFERIRERARQLAKENQEPALGWEELKKMRDEGRP